MLAPAKPSGVKFEDLYEPKLVVIAEMFHFYKRGQHEGETAAVYSAALRNCSEHCVFSTYLEEALRDRFVSNLRSKQTQRRLFTEKELTKATIDEYEKNKTIGIINN